MAKPGARMRGGRWLLGSLVLHASLLAVALRPAQEARPNSTASVPTSEFEVEELAPSLAQEPPVDPAQAVESSATERAPHAGKVPRVTVVAPLAPSDAAPAGEAVPSDSGEAAPPAAAAASNSAPHLSLSQLGVDGTNPFIEPTDQAGLQAARAKRVQQRLDRALAQGTLSQDVAAGRGSASPVLRAIESAVYASGVPLTAQATFSFVIDSSGKLLSSSLGEATGDRAAWLRVAHETARALAGRTLRVPKGKGVKLTVAVTTRLELPSGADPGVEVDVLGIPVKKGAGKRSTRIDLLNPLNPLSPLTLLGDPADIGSRARRMVNAHVLSEELL